MIPTNATGSLNKKIIFFEELFGGFENSIYLCSVLIY